MCSGQSGGILGLKGLAIVFGGISKICVFIVIGLTLLVFYMWHIYMTTIADCKFGSLTAELN